MTVSIEGFDNIITEAVQRRVEVSIADAMRSETDGIIERLVKEALAEPVKVGGRYSGRDMPFLKKLARETIQTATQDAMQQWVKEAGPQIRAELEKQMGTAKFRRDLASSMLSSMLDYNKKSWFNVSVDYKMVQPGE